MVQEKQLNTQQEIFCQQYALCGNASRSAKDAGYAPSFKKFKDTKSSECIGCLNRDKAF
tara:strand:+ start:801 stop:977 length:177 start_codon:yes stop_codon:yes gene_type:complete